VGTLGVTLETGVVVRPGLVLWVVAGLVACGGFLRCVYLGQGEGRRSGMDGKRGWLISLLSRRRHEEERAATVFWVCVVAVGPSHGDVEWNVWREGWQWNWNVDRHRHRHLKGHRHWDLHCIWAIHWHWHLVWHGHGSVNHHYLSLEGGAWLVDFHFCLLGHCW
jgi:hypothetical protein